MRASTYLSGEDSEMLRSAMKREHGDSILEIGVGYGSNLRSILTSFKTIVGTDIQRTSAFSGLSEETGIALIVADRATCFKDCVFDVTVMNPPYLPSSRIEEIALDGGSSGFEVPRLFLSEAFRVTKRYGKILIVLSSETDLEQFKKYCTESSWEVKTLLQRTIFFETLFVFELQRCKA